MSGASIPNQITGRWVSQQTREINNEYFNQIQAQNSEAALRCQREQLKAGLGAAALNLRGQMEIARRQDATNQILDSVAGDMGSLLGLAERMTGQLDSIQDSFDSGLDKLDTTMERGFASVTSLLERAVTFLIEQQRTLAQIADTLSSPYETKALELLRAGQKWLETGARTEGREQQENWNDAYRLFQRVIDNEIGKQNYVAWFNIGYLRWQHLKDVAQAEEAFFQAQRLSAPARDLWHTKSLRHMAAMQREQDNLEGAYQTIHRALAVSREYESLRDAARYANKTGRSEEFLKLLDECIEMKPETIITMFAEEDFK